MARIEAICQFVILLILFKIISANIVILKEIAKYFCKFFDLLILDQIIFRIVVMVGGVEDAGDASQLDAYMVNKALPHRLTANSAIARNRTSLTMIQEGNLSILLER